MRFPVAEQHPRRARRRRAAAFPVLAVLALVLLGAATADAAVDVKVNFQPAAATVPAGYTKDIGSAYSATTGMGWVRVDSLSSATHTPLDLTLNTRQRNAVSDLRQDTFIHMAFPSSSSVSGTATPGAWELAVPSGTYTVTAGVGDASYTDSIHRINAEGQTLLANFTPTTGSPFKIATGTVTVTDGRLTIDQSGGTNTKLDFITVADAVTGTDTTPPAQVTGVTPTPGDGQVALAWTASTASDFASYRVFRGTSTPVSTSGTPLKSGVTTPTTTDTTAVNGTTYYYVVQALDTSGNASTASAAVPAKPVAAPAGQSPWTTAVTLPGTLEAENYDKGGEGVAYHDTDAANVGGTYRTTEGVDVESTTDTGGGYAVGAIKAGEWTEYTVDVPTAGKYDIGIRFGSGSNGGRAHVELNGTNVSGTINLPGTGDWENWTTVWVSNVTLAAVTNGVLRLSMDATNGGDIGNVNQIMVRSAVTSTPATWPSSWSTGASAPEGRFEATTVVFNDKLYAFGGFKDNQWRVLRDYEVYDPATNKWTKLGTLPVGMAETHLGATTDGTYMYFAGGLAGDYQNTDPPQVTKDQVYRYDPAANTWTQIATLPAPRGAGGLALVGRELHYIGGFPEDNFSNPGTHWVYNLDTKAWTTAPSMPDPKDHFSTVVLNGQIYCLGGEHGHHELHDQSVTAHRYDPVTQTWTTLANAPTPKSHDEGATFVSDGKIIMAGGQIDTSNAIQQPTNQVVAYDPTTDRWSTIGALPAARQGASIQRIGTKVIVTLGGTTTAAPQRTTWTGQMP